MCCQTCQDWVSSEWCWFMFFASQSEKHHAASLYWWHCSSAIWESSLELAQSEKFQLKALITAELMSLLLAALSALSCEIYLKITKNYNNFFFVKNSLVMLWSRLVDDCDWFCLFSFLDLTSAYVIMRVELCVSHALIYNTIMFIQFS